MPLVYVFIGSVIVGPSWYRYLPGAIVGIVGIGYIVLEYIPSIEPPANMRYVQPPLAMFAAERNPNGIPDNSDSDADAGWGAEQV